MDVFQVQEPLKSLDDIDLFTGAVLYASQHCGWHILRPALARPGLPRAVMFKFFFGIFFYGTIALVFGAFTFLCCDLWWLLR